MKEQTENNSNMDMKNFLCPLRRLSPTAPANSPTAKTAVGSDTLTRSGYARSDHENQSTALPWSFDSSLFYLHSGDVVPRMHIILYKNRCYVACAD